MNVILPKTKIPHLQSPIQSLDPYDWESSGVGFVARSHPRYGEFKKGRNLRLVVDPDDKQAWFMIDGHSRRWALGECRQGPIFICVSGFTNVAGYVDIVLRFTDNKLTGGALMLHNRYVMDKSNIEPYYNAFKKVRG